MVDRLVAAANHWQQPLAETTGALLAYELDPVSVARARAGVVMTLARHDVAPAVAEQLAAAWVQQGDYLAAAPQLPAADFVIGNPPYIRLEEIDVAVMAGYRQHYRTMVGRADLYVAFYEAALRSLRPDGVCAFICADRWMRNQYGTELRRLVTSGFAVETVIELHRAAAFDQEVSAYPAITVLRRRPQATTVVARAEPGIERLATPHLAQALATAAPTTTPVPELAVTRVDGWFTGGAPWPCTSPARLALLKHLEATFPTLESPVSGTRIGIGVATGADSIFITRESTLVEPDRLLPLAMAASTKQGQLAWTGHYLVNPWQAKGLVDLAHYPRLQAYLTAHEQSLRRRHIGQRSGAGWYRTIDRVDPALTSQQKLYMADINVRLQPVLDPGTTYPHHNLYWLTSTAWDLEMLGGLLLSDIAQFFVECYGVRMRGGYLRFQAQYLRRIRVPVPTSISPAIAASLRAAFQCQDRAQATAGALMAYSIPAIPAEEA